uniref:Uncharacterized protein n=1 Tax=Ciona savignyi TaxID=51511 RepID=H2YF29_CIOSA
MSNFLCLVAISVVFSLGAAERRWCRPSLVDVTIAIDGWVEYDDVTFACVSCPANTSQTRLINRRRLDSYECCNGLLLAKGSCNEVVRNPAGTCSMGEKCDGVKQCTDGSDELNCGACNGTNRFSCSQYHDIEPCVGTDQVCDGRKDCELGLDETGCNWFGGWCDGFLCGGAHPRCIPQSQVCDGTKQCMDGSDEHNCRYCL